MNDSTREWLWRMIWELPLVAAVCRAEARPRLAPLRGVGFRNVRKLASYRERENVLCVARTDDDELDGIVIKQMVDEAAYIVARRLTMRVMAGNIDSAAALLFDTRRPLRKAFLAADRTAREKLRDQFHDACMAWLADVGRRLDAMDAADA